MDEAIQSGVCSGSRRDVRPLLVHVSQHYRPIGGGQEVYIENLSRVMSGAGWDNRVIQPYRGVTAPDTATVPRIPGMARVFPVFDELQFACFAAACRVSLLNRADVILCHYASTAALIARIPRWRRKTIVLSHGVEWNVDRMNVSDRLRESNARRLFGTVTTVANDTDYLRRMGMNAAPRDRLFSELSPGVWFVPNCVNTVQFSINPVPDVLDPGKPTILVPRQICLDRGIHLAIEAFASLVVRWPGARLIIIGQASEPCYYKRCCALAASLGLGNQIEFRTPVSNGEMPRLYASADVTLIPTLRREGTSLSALESMACGVPVVATDVAGLCDLPAFLCRPVASALADGLDAVLLSRNDEARRQRRAVCEQYSIEAWAVSWLRVLTSVRTGE